LSPFLLTALLSEKEPHSLVVLYPFRTNNDKIQSNDFKNSSWKLSSNNDYFNNVTFHFRDSGIVNTVKRGEKYGSANHGEWRIFNSGSFYCLYVSDRRYMEENIFYLTRKENDELQMLVDYQDFLEHPVPIDIKLKPIAKPKAIQLNKIKKTIIGKWDFESFINHTDTVVFDSLINIIHSIEFLPDDTYRLANNIKYIDSYSNELIEYSHEENGKWKLSNTGDYITLETKEKWKRNLAIFSLNSTTVQFDLSYSYDDHSTFDARIKMIKENEP
jgi:hypothetical protein